MERKKRLWKPFQLRKKTYDLQPYPVSKENACNNKETQLPRVRCQYIYVFVGVWICFLIGSVRISTSINVVAMVNQSALVQWTKAKSDSCLPFLSNSTPIENAKSYRKDGEFVWSPEIQGYIHGSYYVGYVVVQVPSGRLVERFGSKWILFATILITGASTLLFPAFSWLSWSAVVTLNLLRGLAQGCCQPAISILTANWFTRIDRGHFYSLILTGTPMGHFLGSIFAGLLCDSLARWPSSFYVFGACGMIISFMILFLVYENPNVHPRISKAELDFILNNQETKLSTRRPDPPWCEILTSVPVYAMMFACFGQNWGISQFLIAHSSFLATIMHYEISENGTLISVTFVLQYVIAQLATWLSSLVVKRNIASIDFTRKFVNFVSCLGFSVCVFGVYFVGCDRYLSIAFGVLATGFTGLGFASVWILSADMSPTFAGMLCALGIMAGNAAAVFLPLTVGYLTAEMQTLEQWNKVFFISIGVVMSSGIAFAIFGSAEVQPWNYVQKEIAEKKKEKQTRF